MDTTSIDKKSVEDSIAQTKASIEILNELQKQLELGCSTLIPLTRTYLEEVRSLRMGFAGEVSHIIASVRQLNEITKSSDKIKEFATNVGLLRHVLIDHDTLSTLEKLFTEKKND